MTYINSNVTAEDFFRYHCTDENAKRFWEKREDKEETAIKELEATEKRLELIEEQNEHAESTLEKIEELIEHFPNTGGAKELKKNITRILQDSMFER